MTESMKLNFETVNIASILDSVMDNMESPAKAKKVSIHVEIQSGLKTILADPISLEKILTNLIENAIKFNREEGQVDISAKRLNPNRVTFSVKDTGIGIAQDEAPKLLNAFYQADESLARGFDGVGLGLTLTKYLVEGHGGTITVESELGKGSMYTVTLPTEI